MYPSRANKHSCCRLSEGHAALLQLLCVEDVLRCFGSSTLSPTSFSLHSKIYSIVLNHNADRHPQTPTPIPCYPPLAAVPSLQAKCAQMVAFVLAWEDVVAPMSFLTTRIGLQPTRTSVTAAKAAYLQDRYLQQALAAVEEQAIELLRTAATLGPVFVVSEWSLKYMETTCTAFFPKMASWLTNADAARTAATQLYPVRVVAAPPTFVNALESAAWLACVYQNVCKVAICDVYGAPNVGMGSLDHARRLLQQRESGTLSLVSISAKAGTQTSSIRAFDVAPFLIPKCVQVRGGDTAGVLNLEHFFAQLQTLQGYVSVAAAHESAFSVSL